MAGRDALTNDEFRRAAGMLAELGDMKQLIRLHPHIDPVYFKKNADALHKAAGLEASAKAAAEGMPEPAAEAPAEEKHGWRGKK